MKTVFMNGSFYPLDKYFDALGKTEPGDVFLRENWWTESKALELAAEINEEVVLCGFSRGATYAFTVAQNCPLVKRVVAHSPFYRPQVFNRYFDVTIVRRKKDRTPCGKGAVKLYEEYKSWGYNIEELTLAENNAKSLTWVEYFGRKLGHYFP